MSDPRQNKIISIVGARGSGKTYFLKNEVLPAIATQRKTLIIDTLDHPDYREIPVLPLTKLHLWTKGVYRVWCNEDEMPKLCQKLTSLDNIWNTNLVFEDAGKHTADGIRRPLRSLMGDTKQKNIDMFFMFWAWGEVHPKILRKTNYVECFKTADSPEVRKEILSGCYTEALSTWQSVMKNDFKYTHQTIDTGI